MNEPIKVSVKTGTLHQRCRAGFVFTLEARQIEVTTKQLQQLRNDGHLQIEVLSADGGAKQTQTETSDIHTNVENTSSVGDVMPTETEDSQAIAELVNAMLDADIDTTGDKPPTVADVKKLVDFDVNAVLRDKAWTVLIIAQKTQKAE